MIKAATNNATDTPETTEDHIEYLCASTKFLFLASEAPIAARTIVTKSKIIETTKQTISAADIF